MPAAGSSIVEMPEPFLARRIPVELVDGAGQRLEVRRLAQLGLRVGEDRQHRRISRLLGVAEIEQQATIVLKLLQPFLKGDARPGVAARQLLLAAVSCIILRKRRKVSSVT